jgi:hypothetical protein
MAQVIQHALQSHIRDRFLLLLKGYKGCIWYISLKTRAKLLRIEIKV